MAYFRCTTSGSGKGNTLVVSCADDLAGVAITCTNGTKTYTKTCPSILPYEVTFYGLESGTWTVSAIVSGFTYTTTVTVADCVAELGGFNWRIWVDTAKYLDSTDYNSLDEVLADEEAIRELCLEHACVDYLSSIITANSDVETIIQNDLFAKWVNLSDYALDTLSANPVIKALMDVSHKELKGQVPKMTSNTTPSGEAIATSSRTDFPAWKAFDGIFDYNTSVWCSAENQQTGARIAYRFTEPVVIKRFECLQHNSYYATSYKIQASNNGTTWVDLQTFNDETGGVRVSHELDNDTAYLYYGLTSISVNPSYNYFAVSGLQFYAYEYSSKYFLGEWALVGQVPKMTSNTAPYGVASASSAHESYPAWKAFDGDNSTGWASANYTTNGWISYKFVSPICVRAFMFIPEANISVPTVFSLDGSNDGSTWVTLGNYTNSDYTKTAHHYTVSNNDNYIYYRLNVTEKYKGSASVDYVKVCSLQFYAWAPKGNVPVMTSNTAPYGEVIGSAAVDDRYPTWYAFDRDTSTNYICSSIENNNYIGYKFVNPVMVKKFSGYLPKGRFATFKIQASNDNSTWIDVTETLTLSDGTLEGSVYIWDAPLTKNLGYYLYYRLIQLTRDPSAASGLQSLAVRELQFYGRELKDLVPPMISNTLPSGVAFASTEYSSSNAAYRAFDKSDSSGWLVLQGQSNNYIGYEFDKTSPILMAKVKFNQFATSGQTLPARNFTLQASDDGTSYGNALATFNVPAITATTAQSELYASFNEQNKKYFRLFCPDVLYVSGVGYVSVYELQLFGKDYSEKEFEEGTNKKWLYDHGVELETLTAKIEGSGSIVTRNFDSVYIEVPETTHTGAHIYSQLDLTPYDLLRVRYGDIFYATNASYAPGFIAVWSQVPTESSSAGLLASSAPFMGDSSLPNNSSLDVSSIDQNGYVSVSTTNVGGTINKKANFIELWLE